MMIKKVEESNFSYGLWGFCKVNQPYHVEQTEVLIGEWLTYMYYKDLTLDPTVKKDRVLHDSLCRLILKVQPDSTLYPSKEFISYGRNFEIFKKCNDCELLKISSLDGVAYLPFEKGLLADKKKRSELKRNLEYPIAGLTYEQVKDFCAWRTRLIDLCRIQWLGPNSFGIPRVVYRLPTAAEFDLLNAQYDSLDTKEQSQFNYKNSKNDNASEFGSGPSNYLPYGKKRVGSRSKNSKLGCLLNIQGNVAEMTDQKGVACGGSFYHYAALSYSGTKISYSKPENWLGFRCLVVRVE